MPAPNTVTPADIYAAFVNAGATPAQAAGLLGNIKAESGLNPESAGLDRNGYWSYGLFNWNTQTYPDAKNLVTGNPAADLANQVAYFMRQNGLQYATGSDPSTIAANFAHGFERCAACGYNAGSGQLQVRSAYAQTFAQDAATGNWANALNPSGAQFQGPQYLGLVNPSRPIWSIDLPIVGSTTIINAQQARTIKAFAFIGAGGLVMTLGVGVLLASFGRREILDVVGLRALSKGLGARRSSSGPPAPDEDDQRAITADKDRERTAAQTGTTQQQRYDQTRRRRTVAGPGDRRGYERRQRQEEEEVPF